MSATTKQLREAFVHGRLDQQGYTCTAGDGCDFPACRKAWEKAKEQYPAQTTTRPRVVSISDPLGRVADARISNGRLEIRSVWKDGQEFRTGMWRPSKHTRQSLQTCLDLFANPTETIEVGE